MKIAIVSRPATIMNWAEDAEQDFSLDGHDVKFVATRHRFFPPVVNNAIYSDAIGRFRASMIVATLRKYNPDLILAFGAYQLPRVVLDAIASMSGRAPFVGWVGVKFSDAQSNLSEYFDLVAYADSGLVRLHDTLGLKTSRILLPLAAREAEREGNGTRSDRLLFVANPNPHRRNVLNLIQAPVDIFGPRWSKETMAGQHSVCSKRMSPEQVRELYRTYALTLNMRSDASNIDGLNQRHFAPYVYGCAVVAEYMKDLDIAFDVGREIISWSSIDELNEVCRRVGHDRESVNKIARAGHQRIKSEHLYRHRLATLKMHLDL